MSRDGHREVGAMSYDLSIRADPHYSRFALVGPLAAFLSRLPGILPNGDRGFIWESPPKRLMEIDLEVVDREGNLVEEEGQTYPEVNCISLHIPYGGFDDTRERPYLPIASAIAGHLGWRVFDHQRGRHIPGGRPTDGKSDESGEVRQLRFWE
jgi:hypothetical protein